MWFEVTVRVPQHVVDDLSVFLDEHGSIGQQVKDGPSGDVDVVAYFGRKTPQAQARRDTARYLEALREQGLLSEVPQARWRATPEDWQDSWRPFFRPIQVTPRLVVRPSWEPCILRPGQCEIVIDPKTAFGTGRHETTRICLCAEETLVRPGVDVLDVGAGTGILCIRAIQLGARRALGLDTDPEAVVVARENLAANQVAQAAQVRCGDARDLEGSFDVILSNIQSSVLVPLLPTFARLLAHGGTVVLSGVLAEEEADFRRSVAAQGFRADHIRREGEWIGIEATRETG